jgi:hypothetical protein
MDKVYKANNSECYALQILFEIFIFRLSPRANAAIAIWSWPRYTRIFRHPSAGYVSQLYPTIRTSCVPLREHLEVTQQPAVVESDGD